MQEIEKENKTKMLINLNLNHCIANGKCADIVYPITWLRAQWMCVCYGIGAGGGELGEGGGISIWSRTREWSASAKVILRCREKERKYILKKTFKENKTKNQKLMCEKKREYSISKCSTLWNEEEEEREEEKKVTLTSSAAGDGQRTPKKSKSSWEFQSTPQLWNKAFPK